MAQGGGIEGAVGGEAEAREAEVGGAGVDPFGAALATHAAATGAPLDPHTATYLEEQTRLVRLQIRHFDEERRLAIEAAKRKRYSDRMRNALSTAVALVVLGLVAGIGAMIWSASNDHGLVVEAFSVPPDLAQKGLSGQVVAKRLLDRLSQMDAQAETLRAPGSYRNNWGDDIKVEIPETGVSLGELRRVLTAWLGHQTHISGEVFHTPTGLVVTARTAQDAAERFAGTDADLEQLIDQSAEAVYRRTQPYRYAKYLNGGGRFDEELKILNELALAADPLERAWAHIQLGYLSGFRRGDSHVAVAFEQAALRDRPNFAPALSNLEAAQEALGHDQEALRTARAYLAAKVSIDRDITAARRQARTAGVLGDMHLLMGDYSAALSDLPGLGTGGSLPVVIESENWSLANALLLSHDLDGARRAANALGADRQVNRYLVLGRAALEQGDPSALALLSRAQTLRFSISRSPSDEYVSQLIWPWIALAKARFGDLGGARELIARTASDCYACLRVRGAIAALGGDRAGAERWYGEAIRQGPELPQAMTDRGAERLASGDLAGARADAEAAHKISPHNGDALKLLGDVRAREDQWKAALKAYGEALKYAPAWTALRQARDAAAKHVG